MMGAVVVGIAVGLVGSSGVFLYDYVDEWMRDRYDVDDEMWSFYTALVAFVTIAISYKAFSILITWWYY